MMRQPPPAVGKMIRIDTERFTLRTLVPGDASERWAAWLNDIDVMGPVNTELRKLSVDDLKRYVQRFDQQTRLLIGIFDRQSRLHIGFYQIDLNAYHRTAKFNVIIGDKDYWGRKVVLETRAALLDHMFNAGADKAIGSPLARNFPAVFNYKAQGWKLEGILRAQVRQMNATARLDQYEFGLLKDEWLARKSKAAT
jgi:RimJ/RimL family protein N-acetyltransferase